MFKFFVLACLAFSLAECSDNHAFEHGKLDILSEEFINIQHDETAKQTYSKALTEIPVFMLKKKEICDNYKAEHVQINLFTKSNLYPHPLYVDVAESLKSSSYDVKKPTKIIVTTLYETIKYNNVTELVAAYLRHHSERVNVITISIEKFFGCDFVQFLSIHDYVSRSIAQLVKQLHHYGSVPDNIHMMGIGMSAHLIGSAAKKLMPYKVGRITGFDPSGGIFDAVSWLGQLDVNDADFVDVIVTNSAKYGTKKERGTVQFYPNGGEIQPESDDLGSHIKAIKYFIESIVRPGTFKSTHAESWESYVAGTSSGKVTYMGEYASPRSSGRYYTKVNPLPPFSVEGKTGPMQEPTHFITRGSVFKVTPKTEEWEVKQVEEGLMQYLAGPSMFSSEETQDERFFVHPTSKRVAKQVVHKLSSSKRHHLD